MSAQTEVRKRIAEEALTSGVSPLDYMLEILRDVNQPSAARFAAAKEAAPYVHPRLAAVQHSGDKENPLALVVTSGVPRLDGQEPEGDKVNGHASH